MTKIRRTKLIGILKVSKILGKEKVQEVFSHHQRIGKHRFDRRAGRGHSGHRSVQGQRKADHRNRQRCDGEQEADAIAIKDQRRAAPGGEQLVDKIRDRLRGNRAEQAKVDKLRHKQPGDKQQQHRHRQRQDRRE